MTRSSLLTLFSAAVFVWGCSDASVPQTGDTAPNGSGGASGNTAVAGQAGAAGAGAAGAAGETGRAGASGGGGLAGASGGGGSGVAGSAGSAGSAGAGGAAGPCVGVVLDDGDACTIDACDPTSGVVTHVAKVDGSKNTLCSQTVCDPATGVVSEKDLADDGNACTFDECDVTVGPVHTPKPLGDGDPCTKDSCDPQTGVTHTVMSPCMLLCVDDFACDDGNPCTLDTCDPETTFCGSVPVADGTSASDGNVCNGTEMCIGGKKQAGDPVLVDDGNPCTQDSCDPKTGMVSHVQVPGCVP